MRRLVVVRGALGPVEPLASALARAGFGKPVEVDTVDALLPALEALPTDLVVLPASVLADASAGALAAHFRSSEALAVIGTADTPDPTLILAGMRAGMAEFLTRPVAPADLEVAIARLEPRWAKAARRGSVIAVYSPSGGAGVTTVAVNVAHAIARRKPAGRVVVADFVVGLGDVTTHLNLAPLYDMGELVRNLDRADLEALQSITVRALDGMDVLASAADLELGESVTADAVQRTLTLMRSAYSYTVLDLEHTLSPRTIAALDAADRLLLVFQVNVASLRQVKRALSLFERLEIAPERIMLVANRTGGADVMPWPDVTKAIGRTIDCRLPNAFQAVADAQTRGLPIASANAQPAAVLVEAYDVLASRLMGAPGAAAPDEPEPSPARGLGRLFGRRRS